MYTVLIVEDEVIVSIGLRNMVQWADMNMEVIGEAQNGKQGLEMYYERKPDIILTDIKMPVMDGLEMIEEIRRNDPITKIVVLTCYEEFDMVRRAFKLGISDYILKLEIMPDDMCRIMQKIQNELIQEGVEDSRSNPDKLDSMASDALKKCRNYLLRQSGTLEEFRACLEDLKIPEKGLVVCAAKIVQRGNTDWNEQEIGPKKETDHISTEHMAIHLIWDMLIEMNRGVIFSSDNGAYILVVQIADREKEEERKEFLQKLLQRIQSALDKYLHCRMIVGASRFADAYEELPALYDEAFASLNMASLLEEESLQFDDLRGRQHYEKILDEWEKRLTKMDWLQENCRDRILNEIIFLRGVSTPKVEAMQELFSRWIHQTSFDGMLQRAQAVQTALDAAEKVRCTESLTEMIRIYDAYTQRLLGMREARLVSSAVAQAAEYAREHYREDNISMSKVADLVELQKDYLSNLFKKEMGIGFIDFVNDLRIKEAQRMLRSPGVKSYEVAFYVGFRDEGYFSRVFKKKVGISPNDYKKREIDT